MRGAICSGARNVAAIGARIHPVAGRVSTSGATALTIRELDVHHFIDGTPGVILRGRGA